MRLQYIFSNSQRKDVGAVRLAGTQVMLLKRVVAFSAHPPPADFGGAIMVRTKYLIFGLLGILGLLAFYFFFPSEEKQIKKRFTLLSEYASKDQGESTFTMAHKVKSIGALFPDKVKLRIPDYELSGSYTRQDIENYAVRVRLSFSRLSLQFFDLSITFSEKGAATVTLTGRLTGKSASGEEVDETRELAFALKKIEDQWLFSEVEVVEVSKK
jgi:hypothetical protein